MALKAIHFRSSGGPMEGSDAAEVEQLEAEVHEMSQKLLHYRATLPDQLKSTFNSILSSQRQPFLEFLSGFEPRASGEPNAEAGQSSGLLAEGDHETTEKMGLLKQKILSNVSTIPVILKRLNECMSMVDKLDSYSGIMHPSFKRKRTD